MTLTYMETDSTVGRLKLVANDTFLVAILWEIEKPNRVKLDPMTFDGRNPILKNTAKQLSEYFSGKRKSFDIRLEYLGTEFQTQVWDALKTIPYGQTVSYAEIAQQIGKPNAVRAVGTAIGRNPISIIVPCHRVIGSDGSLTGFAGGLARKKKLLEIEGVCN